MRTSIYAARDTEVVTPSARAGASLPYGTNSEPAAQAVGANRVASATPSNPLSRKSGRRRGSLSWALGSWSLLLLSVTLLRIVAAMKLEGDPSWLMGDGPVGLGHEGIAGLALAAMAWLLAPLRGVLSFLRRTPGLWLLAALHAMTVLVFPPMWLLDALATPEVRFRIETDKPAFALTIDDGVDPTTTPKLLEVLARYDAKATFFVLGESVQKHPRLIEQIQAEGHELANHQMTDTPSIALSPEDLDRQIREADTILRDFGASRWFRPGGGFVTETTEAVCQRLGLKTALGSVFPFDSHIGSARFIAAYVASRTEAGSIVVLHDGPGRAERTARALDRALPALQGRGLNAQTLSDVIE